MAMRPFVAPGARLALRSKRPGRASSVAGGDSEVILDVSRLLSRAFHPAPTGIDRVEYIYARELLERMPDRLSFAAVHPAGGYYGRLDNGAVRQFLAFTAAKWRNAGAATGEDGKAGVIRHMFATRPRPVPPATRPRIYLQVSPHHLDDQEKVGAILRAEGARMVVMAHDVIPLSHPEYARPDGAQEHMKRVRTMDRFAAGIIGNSQATIDALAPHLTPRLDGRATCVAHFGADAHESAALPIVDAAERPYFVYISTIEPRKNHLLLLTVWRRLVERLDDGAPRLILIGRRGWENENVVDILERADILHDHVIEAGEVSDSQMHALIAGARAMLMPSFVEGFGMPVVEALCAGAPVICSDIAAHREVGGAAPDYLDPIDGLGWMQKIEAYAAPESPERAAQMARIADWNAPTWQRHFDIVTRFLADVCADAR